jgi:polysaccharide deacetylase family protein (PEP-CTERM system associated)
MSTTVVQVQSRKPPRSEFASAARSSERSLGRCVFSVDVEDWFHILDVPSSPPISLWDRMPSRVEANFYRLLDIFSMKRAHVTCFFLGWVAEKFPHLVREAVQRGHEIGSHGYSHRLVYQMAPREFSEDARYSRLLLEDLTGSAVLGYRSAGFSMTDATPWFFQELAAAGYVYDSSVFPATRGHGGMPAAVRSPHIVGHGNDRIVEFPITVTDLGAEDLCFFGGGYLRLSPYWLIQRMARKVLASGRPVVFYIHPREIDPTHPRLPMSLPRRFKSYVNLHGTEEKLLRILEDFPVGTFRNFLATDGLRWELDPTAA